MKPLTTCGVTKCETLVRDGYAQLRVPTQTVLVQGEAEYPSSSRGTVVFPICEKCFYDLQKMQTRRRLVAVGMLPESRTED